MNSFNKVEDMVGEEMGTGKYVEDWSPEKIRLLVDYYANEAVLWDTTKSDYNDRDLRAAALERIDQAVEVMPGEAYKKLKHLRTYYMSEVRKEMRHAGQYTSKWKLFHQMDSFLRAHIAHKSMTLQDLNNSQQQQQHDSSINNSVTLSGEDDDTVAAGDIKQEQADIERDSGSAEDCDNDHNTGQQTDSSGSADRLTTLRRTILRSATSWRFRKQRQKLNEHRIEPYQNNKRGTVFQKDNNNSAMTVHSVQGNAKQTKMLTSLGKDDERTMLDDPDTIFGLHIANELRLITNLKAKQFAKLQIHNILFNAQFGLANVPSSPKIRVPDTGFTE